MVPWGRQSNEFPIHETDFRRPCRSSRTCRSWHQKNTMLRLWRSRPRTTFFRLYNSLQDNIVFSDGGNSFKEKCASVLEALGFTHEVYPAAVHQYLSPHDNKLHGTAKRSWRTACHDFTDDVYCSIKLLHLLDRDTVAHSKTWFDRNILKLDRDSVAELIGGRQAQQSADIRVKCERAYKISRGMDMRSSEQIGTPLQELEGALDG